MIVAANRLPTSTTVENGQIVCKKSPGGLSSALQSINKATSFVGWNGSVLGLADQEKVSEHLSYEHTSTPIFLSEDEVKQYYLGFSNSVLWPLFHSLPDKIDYKHADFETYKKINSRFAEEIVDSKKSREPVFVQDYHLLLLPQLLRHLDMHRTIGFFLHTPFPHYEIFRYLPQNIQQELLFGLLGSDIIGFHTAEYVERFKEVLEKTLGVKTTHSGVFWQKRFIALKCIPLGIDYEKFVETKRSDEVQKHVVDLRKKFRGKKILFSVDRLDYTKGLTQKIKAFELFLQESPELHRKIVFLINVQPSRTDIQDYKELKKEIENEVLRINACYGDKTWKPIEYNFTSLNFEQMVAHYNLSDIAVITPLCDGMNLVAKEFVASKKNDGVLILSSTAGAAEELTDALIVNPHNLFSIANAIKKAVDMSSTEQSQRIEKMQEILQLFNVKLWGAYWMKFMKSHNIQIPISRSSRLSQAFQ